VIAEAARAVSQRKLQTAISGRRWEIAAEGLGMSARAHPSRARPPARAPGYRARPAPRSRSRGRRTRVNWEKLGRRVLVLVLFAVLASYLNPVVNLVDDWRDSRAEQERFEALKHENARLVERTEAIEDPKSAQLEARRLGMVGPGERAYVIRELPD
jgi:cell division protein FtsB